MCWSNFNIRLITNYFSLCLCVSVHIRRDKQIKNVSHCRNNGTSAPHIWRRRTFRILTTSPSPCGQISIATKCAKYGRGKRSWHPHRGKTVKTNYSRINHSGVLLITVWVSNHLCGSENFGRGTEGEARGICSHTLSVTLINWTI